MCCTNLVAIEIAWSKCPIPVLDDSYFRRSRRDMYSTSTEFWDFTRNSIHKYIDQRYQNLSVDKLILRVEITNDDVVSRLDELIVYALKLRVDIELNMVICWMSVLSAQSSHFCSNQTLWSLEKLRKLLTVVCQYKIPLSIMFSNFEFVCCSMRTIRSTPAVENLMVSFDSNKGYDLFMAIGGLLWSCSPKFLSLCYDGDMKGVQCLYEKLVNKANQNCLNTTSIGDLCCLHDLKEVNVELFEESVMEWQPTKDSSEILAMDLNNFASN